MQVPDSTREPRDGTPAKGSSSGPCSSGPCSDPEAAEPTPGSAAAVVAPPAGGPSDAIAEATLPTATADFPEASCQPQDPPASPRPQVAEPSASCQLPCGGDSSLPAGQQADLSTETALVLSQAPADVPTQHAVSPVSDVVPADVIQQGTPPPATLPRSRANVLKDGEIEWQVPASVDKMLSLPTAAAQKWCISTGVTPCTLVLPGERRHETQLRTGSSSSVWPQPRPSVSGWGKLAKELGIRGGDVIRMRAAYSSPGLLQEPLELYIRIRQRGSASPPLAAHHTAAVSAGEASAGSPTAEACSLSPAGPAAPMPEASAELQPSATANDRQPPAPVLPSWGGNKPRTPPRRAHGSKAAQDDQLATVSGTQRWPGQKRAAAPAMAWPAKRTRQLLQVNVRNMLT